MRNDKNGRHPKSEKASYICLKICELGLDHLISILIRLTLGCEWIPLLMIEVLLQVEEGVEEDRRHLALLQVLQGDGMLVQRPDHVKHLKGEELRGDGG